MTAEQATGQGGGRQPISPDFYVDPDGAAVVKGALVPGANLAEAVVVALKAQIAADPQLAEKWKADPRAVLADRGLVRDFQDEVLKAQGMDIPEMFCGFTCIKTGGAQ